MSTSRLRHIIINALPNIHLAQSRLLGPLFPPLRKRKSVCERFHLDLAPLLHIGAETSPSSPIPGLGDRLGLRLRRTNLYSPRTLSPGIHSKTTFISIQGCISGITWYWNIWANLFFFKRHLSRRILSRVRILFIFIVFPSPRSIPCSGDYSVSLETKSNCG